jgi:hypothetical protein
LSELHVKVRVKMVVSGFYELASLWKENLNTCPPHG